MISLKLDHPFDPSALLGGSGVAWLDSAAQAYGMGRYSVLGVDPYQELVCAGEEIEIRRGGKIERERGDPLEVLRRELGAPVQADAELPFFGGAIGYLSYDLVRATEAVCSDLRFYFYDRAYVIDHDKGEAFAVVADRCPDPEQVLEALALKAKTVRATVPSGQAGKPVSNFSREDYVESVERIRRLIRDGEVYQVNLAQRFEAEYAGSPASLYQRLRRSNPAPYGAYLDYGDEQILCSSPERFLTVRSGRAETRPIKGTRPRGKDAAEESRYRSELAVSEKDRSELLMIVDLERNDLGKVCRPGSVRTKELFQLENYAKVIHQTATVSGELEDGLGAIDALRAMFPGGSITGAPKIRAMEVIEELEPHRRGVYTGSIGYVGFDGNADFNIAIRTMRLAGGALSFHAGGGVVWDSDPESEYEETLHKAQALFDAL